MGSKYFPTYSTIRNEIVDFKLNLTGHVTQKEFKNLTKIDTSDFDLKTNVAELETRVDEIDVDKINIIDELQGKNFVEQNYLVYVPMNKYLSKTSNTENILSRKSMGVSDDLLKSLFNSNVPQLHYPYSYMQVNFKRSCLVNENKSSLKKKC